MTSKHEKKVKVSTKASVSNPTVKANTSHEIFALLGATWFVWQVTTQSVTPKEIFLSLGLDVEYSKFDLLDDAGELMHPRFKN